MLASVCRLDIVGELALQKCAGIPAVNRKACKTR
jgi:hypothetical protein